MVAFATTEDVRARWAAAPTDDTTLSALLEDAALWLSAWFPSIPDPPSGKLAGVLKLVSVAMVKRALMSADTDHLVALTDSAGTFSQSRTFRNPDGNLFLTSQERTMVERALDHALGRGSGMRTVEAEF